jgi:hypothetical protein
MAVVSSAVARRRLATAARVIARLRAGTAPSAAELRDAAYLESWVIEASPEEGAPYPLSGAGYRVPRRSVILHDLVIALDPKLGWARLLEEWVLLGPKPAATGIDPDDALRRGSAWVARQLCGGEREDRGCAKPTH